MGRKNRPAGRTLIAVLIGGWTAAWLAIPATALSPAGPSKPAPPGFQLAGDPVNGRKVYKMYCQKCHGKEGNGQGLMAQDLDPKPRDFTNRENMGKRSDWEIFLGIKEGGPVVGLSDKMTPWQDTLTEQEMRDVAVYIRQFAQ